MVLGGAKGTSRAAHSGVVKGAEPTEEDPTRGRAAGGLVVWDEGADAPDGPLPLLLLHGWTGSKEDFGAVVRALADGRRVLVPDLPGHGASPVVADGDYSLGAHVVALTDLLDASGVDAFHLLGHSHGGLVAQRLAHALAHRVASLTLVGSGLGALGEASQAMVVRVATAARDRGMDAAWAEAVSGAVSSAADPRAAFTRDRFLAMAPAVVIGVARNLLTTAPLGAFLRGVDFPVLICHGEGDRTWLPHEQRLLARSIRGAIYRVVPNALHSPAVENPTGTLALLEPFLAAADPPARPPAPRTTRPLTEDET